MRKVVVGGTGDLNELAGSFLETAFSAEQVNRAIVEESRLGVQYGVCAFLECSYQDLTGVAVEVAAPVLSEAVSVVV